ncbi:hypothetical protein FRC12_013182 [Ceratobasidium sp. 428]|nr:hypothetical protein FRC12_013182 [Ceratobasidium sp. 428]
MPSWKSKSVLLPMWLALVFLLLSIVAVVSLAFGFYPDFSTTLLLKICRENNFLSPSPGLPLAVVLALALATKRMTKERLLVYVSVVAGFISVHRKFVQSFVENGDRQNLDYVVDDQASNLERNKSHEDNLSLEMADLNTVIYGPPYATLSEAITVNSTALYQSTPNTAPKPEITDTITSIMQMDEVIQHLIQHRCPEITKDLDLDSCSHRPIEWGGFSEVYLGKLHSGTEVAIKCSRKLQSLDRSGGSSEILKHTAREIYAWAKCDHPGILKFRGIARFRDQVVMVSEWMPNGSLSSYLRKRPSINRIQLCVRLSEALEYMHARGIVHGDIKPANVLMSNDDTPLFADFGNALLECETSLRFTPTTSWGMTPRYMASELLNGSSNQHNFKSDIYAFGMMVLEIMTGQVPFPDKRSVVVCHVAGLGEIPKRPDLSSIIPEKTLEDELWGLLTCCWAFEPNSRPSAPELKQQVSKLLPIQRFQTDARRLFHS